MSVWAALVGQDHVVAELTAAAQGAMTHAWLFTGPPGSGRSIAARAFAAALQCEDGGCGSCQVCHTVLAGTHPDVNLVSTEVLSIGVKDTRELVRRAALSPAGGRWQVIVLEDADRLTEQAANVLLKAIEEPPARTVWLLCAPSSEDALPTIRSRCRQIRLVTPTPDAVAAVLVERDQVPAEVAEFAAHASQGHIGRARRLATDEQARQRRSAVLALPHRLTDVAACLRAAAELTDASAAEAKQAAAELDTTEMDNLKVALGAGSGAGSGTARLASGTSGAVKDLEERQKRRAKRIQRDAMDRALIDLAAYYRDVLAIQLGAEVELINPGGRADLAALAHASTPEATLRRIEAVMACRESLDANAHPLLTTEAMMLCLRTAGRPGRPAGEVRPA
ncbi:MAG: DNA polymerase III subunit delta' [Sporichthyaceae bacterium]|nr:DNA polymerase III subunit delta' [Sporichthyaceae bacterium]